MDPKDILYPECHLDSPIVLGKVIRLHYLLDLTVEYDIKDSSILRNLDYNAKSGRLSNRDRELVKHKDILRKEGFVRSGYRGIDYPRGNKELFRLVIPNLTKPLECLLKQSNKVFDRIESGLRDTFLASANKISGKGKEVFTEQNLTESGMAGVSRSIHNNGWNQPFMTWFTIKKEMRKLKKDYRKNAKSTGMTRLASHHERYSLYIHSDFVLISDHVLEVYHLLTDDMVLGFCDVVEGRLMVSAVASMDPNYVNIGIRGEQLWSLIDSLFILLGNKVYDVVGMLEPLALSYIQLRDPIKEIRGAFLYYNLSELDQLLKEDTILSTGEVKDFIELISEIINMGSVSEISEIFSFFRSFGHPVLEAVTAADKVRDHMCKPKVLDYETLQKGHAVFCSMIINGFRERHGGSWPPCFLPDYASSELKAVMANHAAIPYELSVNNWESFIGFKFDKFEEVNLDEDLTIFMKDKALSPIRAEWDTVYPQENMQYSPGRSSTSRRLVDVFLEDMEFNPQDIIDYVVSGSYLIDQDFNISYSLKEKEIKQAGRLFAKMTYKMRAAQVLAESLVAHGVGKYFQENGMVKDEHELLKSLTTLSLAGVPRSRPGEDPSATEESKFVKIAQKGKEILRNNQTRRSTQESRDQDGLANEKHETVASFITTDLQKFCLNWRYESVILFAQRLDEIYGLPGFFEWLHKRLEKSVLYVADPNCPPDFRTKMSLEDTPDTGIFIHNPMGGIEGYSQKMWTIISISMIHLAAVQTGVRVSAVIQGDNQSIAVTTRVPVRMNYNQKKTECYKSTIRYFETLRKVMGGLGHNLKLNETIISNQFFIYSKRIYFDGSILPQGLKTISRCVFWSETLVDETRAACSNISTSLAKAVENGISPLLCYLLNAWKTLQQLHISLAFSINPTITKDLYGPILSSQDWMIIAVIVPSQLGGFNYMSLSRLFVRNIGDPLVAALADVKRYIEIGLLTTAALTKFTTQVPGDSTELDWASDPYSANLPHSQSVTTVIKHVTARSVLSKSPNPMLEGLFHENTDEEDHDLARFLIDREIILPRVANVILDQSVTGARSAIAGLLDTTKTLIKNTANKGGLSNRTVSKLLYHDYQQFIVFNKILRSQVDDTTDFSLVCSVTLAKIMRSRMWVKVAKGRRIEGLEVPDPLECLRGELIVGSGSCTICERGMDQYSWFYIPPGMDLEGQHRENGSLRVPYFGSSTSERSEASVNTTRGLSRAAKAAIRIASVYTWAYGESQLSWYEAYALASQRANLTLEQLKVITPKSTSTSLSHRLNDSSTQMKFASTNLQRVSRFVTISNDHIKLKGNGDAGDTNLIYQQVMLVGLSIIELTHRRQENTGEDSKVLHLHIREDCCVEFTQDQGDIPSLNNLPEFEDHPTNRLIYDPNPLDNIYITRIKETSVYLHELDFLAWHDEDIKTVLGNSVGQMIEEVIATTERDNLKDINALSNEDNINSIITEMMLSNPDDVLSSLGCMLVLRFAYECYARHIEGKEQYISYVSDKIETMSRSNLSILINSLTHPRVFRKYCDEGVLVPDRGQTLSTQDFRAHSVEYCIASLQRFFEKWTISGNITILLCDQDEVIIGERELTLKGRIKAMIICIYCLTENSPSLVGLNTKERDEVLTEYLEEVGQSNIESRYWVLGSIGIKKYNTSLTYIRRSLVKQYRLRDLDVQLLIDEMAEQDMESLSMADPIFDQVNKTETMGSVSLWQSIKVKDLTLDRNPRAESAEYRIPTTCEIPSQILRIVGVNSTSCSKAHELNSVICTLPLEGKSCLFLAEGSGSMMTYYMLRHRLNNVYFNTGVGSEDINSQRETDPSPSEPVLVEGNLRIKHCLSEKVTVLFNGRPETTWVGNEDCESYVTTQIGEDKVSLVHSDMESGIEKSNQAVLVEHVSLIKIFQGVPTPGATLVSKIAPRLGTNWTQIISLYLETFTNVTILCLKNSNPASSELYVICDGVKTRIRVKSIVYAQCVHYLTEESQSRLEQRIIDAKLKAGEHLMSVINDLKSGEKINQIESLLKIGFSANMTTVARQFLRVTDLTDTTTIFTKLRLALVDLLRVTSEESTTLSLYQPYPLSQSGKCRVVKERAMKGWISINLNTIFTKRNYLKHDFEYLAVRNKVIIDMKCLLACGVVNKKTGDRLNRMSHLLYSEITNRDKKKLFKLIGSAFYFSGR
ncbi:large putative polymerase L [Fer-de-lance virus]|uniref:RNA-directed RNA polymerase L n=1 Tax=Fer-de-lance virus TaxID=2907837 RepID=Q6YIR9_9MONO|nr:large putative polymerase L [Fer-de-lance virus]AAN18266.1 large putative polymerase L [Fer-de-lance virus]